MAKQLKGIGASSGISIANVFLLEKENIKIPSTKINNTKEEIIKVKKAFEKSEKEIQNIKKIAEKKIGKEKAMVFDAHIQILSDPEILSQIEDKINNEKSNAVKAVDTVFSATKAIFESMDDQYFKERASDIEDVKTRVLYSLANKQLPNLLDIKEEVIIVSNDLTPSETALLDKKYVKGFATNIGGRTSHAAIMARTLEIPAVLGLKNITTSLTSKDKIIAINGNTGEVEINPNKNNWIKKINEEKILKEKINVYKNKKAKTIDEKQFLIEANIGKASDINDIHKYGAEGVGLFRSEFLYMENSDWPSEQEQYENYKAVLSKKPNELVVVRTLDIGGDKNLPYYSFPHEENPFLGYRAIRFCLDRKEIFKTQLRALGRASVHGKLAIMFPMIATVDEFIEAKKFALKTFEELKKAGHKVADNIQIGMMIEIPSTAMLADKFAKYADFFSIGTNDLIQYSFAADRMSEKVSYLYQPLNPSILRLIELTILGAKKHNRWVGMCGELAGDETVTPILLGLGGKGIDAFSMSASSIPKIKYIINQLNHDECVKLAEQAVCLETHSEVLKLINNFYKTKKIIL